ncbi:MAG: nucleotidyltransferase [Gammaproteobacteria bacterium]|nr:MAG: nucleotidyltransferase [Gammaproteobacteria bacterium]RTZ69092.1 MAG: nucleotidyltransferase [Aquificaceae bacterium]
MALKKLVEDFEKALKRLKEACELANLMRDKEHYEFFRDSTIQRFEFTTEIMWKSLKEFLREKEGIVCKSPKSCIREFFSVGYLKEEETFRLLKAIDDRNRTSHTYHEEVAEEIFSSIGDYLPLFERVLKTLKGVTK